MAMSLNSSVHFMTSSTFGIVDYVMFSLFLAISGSVGIFFSIRGRRNTDDYFYGGRRMSPIPLGLSTGVSFMSAAIIVGGSAETYTNGYSFVIGTTCSAIGYFFGCMTVTHTLHPLGITSVNEYITRRFGSKTLTYATNFIALLVIFHYCGVCMIGSVISFSHITGGQVSVLLALIIGVSVGIFYTSIGGLKAVVWTDAIQSGVMIAGICAVIVQTTFDTPGGLSQIIKLNAEYGRIHEPIWSFDVTVRHSMFGLVVGYFIFYMAFALQPASVQRLCSTKSKRDSYIVGFVASILSFFFGLMPSWAGTNIFGYYLSRGCDVYKAGWIKKNEILVYYVRERLSYPGFQGVFIASLYAGSLSSLSSALNAGSAILWKDTIKPLLKTEVSEVTATLISKALVLIIGVVGMVWCYALYAIGGLIIQIAMSVDAALYGPYFCLFLASIIFRFMNYKGALAGLVVSFVVSICLGIAALFQGSTTMVHLPPTPTNNCASVSSNFTSITNSSVAVNFRNNTTNDPGVKCRSFFNSLFSISYECFILVCITLSLSVSMCVTGCTGSKSMSQSEEKLLLPICRRHHSCLRRNRRDKFSHQEEEFKLAENCKEYEVKETQENME